MDLYAGVKRHGLFSAYGRKKFLAIIGGKKCFIVVHYSGKVLWRVDGSGSWMVAQNNKRFGWNVIRQIIALNVQLFRSIHVSDEVVNWPSGANVNVWLKD